MILLFLDIHELKSRRSDFNWQSVGFSHFEDLAGEFLTLETRFGR